MKGRYYIIYIFMLIAIIASIGILYLFTKEEQIVQGQIVDNNGNVFHITNWIDFKYKRYNKINNQLFNKDYKIILITAGKDERVFFYQKDFPYLVSDRESIILAHQTHNELKDYIARLENRLVGELIPWEDADKLFPLYSRAKIIDINTGLSFNVQRRGGENHSDCQPLTKEDTQIMKTIFNNKWSWEKRAVIVLIDGQKIAGAIHGMPHGSGKIQDNDFPGHFCLYFYGSKGHSYPHMDRDYHDYILRAAGIEISKKPYEFISNLKEKW